MSLGCSEMSLSLCEQLYVLTGVPELCEELEVFTGVPEFA